MGAGARARESDLTAMPEAGIERAVRPGAVVELLRPRELRGTIGIVRRRRSSGWEVEVRTPLGTPMHLTVPERRLRLR